jgi:hypothetical protein
MIPEEIDALAEVLYEESHRDAIARGYPIKRGPNEDWAHLPDVGRQFYRRQARRYLMVAEYARWKAVDTSEGENRPLPKTRRQENNANPRV